MKLWRGFLFGLVISLLEVRADSTDGGMIANHLLVANQMVQFTNRVSDRSPGRSVTPGVRLNPLEYEVEGTMTEVFMSDPGQLREAVQAEFKVFVRGCAWLIVLTEKDATGKPVRKREVGSTNGNEIVDLEYPASPSFSPMLLHVLCPEPCGL